MGYASTTQFTYDLGAVMRRLGQEYHPNNTETSLAWRIGYVGKLIDRHGFPQPLPGLDDAAGTVSRRSKWTIPSVDKWFDDRDPDGTAAADVVAQRAAAATMDARAADLGRAVAGRHAEAATARGLRVVDGAAA